MEPAADVDMMVVESQSQVPGTVRKLDSKTATVIRQGQIVTKISDVVRELVDNSIDAEASSVQILLTNFGIEKIEVKDTGQGIPSSEFKNAVAGGYTSKLKDRNHPSCCKAYGFRGEALSSICSVAKVSITTKTVDELLATKYILDTDGRIESENNVPYGKGTIVSVEKLFSNYPVRKQWIQDKTRRAAELKEVEYYLKAIAIANPKCHISLYHDGSLIWMKATVPTIDQALITVLGHSLSKNLIRCGPVNVAVEEEEKRKRTIEAFLLKRPIDMRTMSYTSNKFTMIFVNRKRVYVREFEKIIQQYNAAVVEKPAPADIRRFPVSVVNISIPSNEVDFNRDMDKSKIFLVHKEEISKKLEEVLQKFYGIDLNEALAELLVPTNSNACMGNIQSKSPSDRTEIGNEHEEASSRTQIVEKSTEQPETIIPTSPVIPTCNKDSEEGVSRTSNIMEFLVEIPKSSGDNFSQISRKEIAGQPLSTLQHVKQLTLPSSNISKDSNGLAVKNCIEEKLGDSVESCQNGGSARGISVSNFELNLEDLCNSQEVEKQIDNNNGGSTRLNDWIHGRITAGNGEIIQNVVLVNKPPPQPQESIYWETGPRNGKSPPTSMHESLNSSQQNAFSLIRSGFCQTNPLAPTPATPSDFGHPAYKRPRLSLPYNGEYSNVYPNHYKSPSGISTSGKQVTLDSYKNWQTPSGRLSQVSHNTPSGIRLPLSGSSSQKSFSSTSRKVENPIGIPPKYVRDSWTKNGSNNSHTSSSSGLVGMRKSIRMDRPLFSCSQNSSQSYSGSKLIGPISGSGLFAAQVKDVIGAFSPLSMLSIFPSLKYDLKISIEELSPQDSTPNLSPKCSRYAVAKDDVPKLFSEFLSVVDPQSDDFPKIFHPLHTLKDAQSESQEAQQNWFTSNSCVA